MAFAAISAAVGIAGTAMSAYGAFQQASAQKAQADYASQVASNNAEIGEDNYADVYERGKVAAFNQRRTIARQLDDTTAAIAGNNLVVGEAGTTPQNIIQSMIEEGELDVQQLRNNVIREARRAQIQAASYTAQAEQFALERDSINPAFSALGAGIGTFAKSGSIGAIKDLVA